LSEIKKVAKSATSLGSKYFFKGWRSVIFSIIRSLRKSLEAKSVLVTVGAIAFTRINGANSAPKDFVRPSTAYFAAAILA